jgi:hypothetical protein
MVTRNVVGSSCGCPYEEISCPFNTCGSWYTIVVVNIRSRIQCTNSSTLIHCCSEVLSFPASSALHLWLTEWTVRGSNPDRSEIFRTHPDRPWGPPSLLYNGYRVFPAGKSAEAWLWPPPSASAEVKEQAELHFYSPFEPSWPVLGWTLPLPLPLPLLMTNKAGNERINVTLRHVLVTIVAVERAIKHYIFPVCVCNLSC